MNSLILTACAHNTLCRPRSILPADTHPPPLSVSSMHASLESVHSTQPLFFLFPMILTATTPPSFWCCSLRVFVFIAINTLCYSTGTALTCVYFETNVLRSAFCWPCLVQSGVRRDTKTRVFPSLWRAGEWRSGNMKKKDIRQERRHGRHEDCCSKWWEKDYGIEIEFLCFSRFLVLVTNVATSINREKSHYSGIWP